MNTYETKHRIGDLVYVANKHNVDREIIKAVKIEGMKEKVSYGMKSGDSPSSFSYLWFGGSDYRWYKSSEIFLDKESAISKHESLKAKHEAEEALEDLKNKKERKQRLLDELNELENE